MKTSTRDNPAAKVVPPKQDEIIQQLREMVDKAVIYWRERGQPHPEYLDLLLKCVSRFEQTKTGGIK